MAEVSVLDAPARVVLQLAGDTDIAWAVFDPAWYLRTYPEIGEALPDEEPATIRAWYLEHGQQRGHSPNILFDEQWHRQAYPAVDAMVRARHVASAFDAYCRGGQTRSPHWLFNEPFYRRTYDDLTAEVLAEHGLANGYDHFLRHGAAEGRIGHLLFDPQFFIEALGEEGEAARTEGPFRYYLRRIEARVPEPRTTVFFDPAWYMRRYPRVVDEIAVGDWRSALEHYLCNNTPTAYDPLPDFSERFYLAQNPGVAATVESGERRNGYMHFLTHGAAEHRAPCPTIDMRWYASQPRVRDDVQRGLAAHAFDHWLRIGRPQGLASTPPPEERPTEAQARSLFTRKAQIVAPLLARAPLDFSCAGPPVVSAVLVLRDRLEQSLAVLASLRANLPGDIDLILVDSGSADETQHMSCYVRGAQVLRFDSDLGPLRGGNAALHALRADAVLYLGNDVELLPGAVAAALACLAGDTRIGAVGGKALRPHGVIDSAGGIVWRDGSITGYQRDASPLQPEANFRRDVDFCPRACLLVRTALLQQLEGFDPAFESGGYADADLCVRVQQAGYRVTYDPAVAYYQTTQTPSQDASRAQAAFCGKHQDWLLQRPAPDPAAAVFARHAGAPVQRVLFIEDMLPLRRLGSGFVRANDLVRSMAAMGCGVTVYPMLPNRFEPAAIHADLPAAAEIIHDRSLDELRDFLQRRPGYYGTIWIARAHNLDRVRPILERIFPAGAPRPRIVLDSEAIAASRQAEQAAVTGEPFDREAAMRREFSNAALCDAVVAVNPLEAEMLRDIGCPNVSVLGHMRALHPTPRPFERRAGMLFIGAMHQPDSPNYDSLCWFIDHVLPLVERELRWETRLTVVGYTAPDVSLDRFREHPRVTLRGVVADTRQLYDSHRLFVAPTRFAAGTPYKVHEAASFGLPVVATDLLRGQLDWQEGQELLSAPPTDPALFARQVVRLYRDPALWQALRDAALERLRRENDSADYQAGIAAVLGPALPRRDGPP